MNQFSHKVTSVALDYIPPTGRQTRGGPTHWERVNQAVRGGREQEGMEGNGRDQESTFPINGFRMTELAKDLREPALACVRRMDEIRSAR